MTFDPPEAQLPEQACCFCGDVATAPVRLTGEWTGHAGDEQSQSWVTHRSCLMQALTDQARRAGGPLFEL